MRSLLLLAAEASNVSCWNSCRMCVARCLCEATNRSALGRLCTECAAPRLVAPPMASSPPSSSLAWDANQGKAAVKQHYEALLGHTYTWMMGGAPKNFDENKTFFEMRCLRPSRPGQSIAIDLGCGSGFQSIPLMELGYRVTSVDLNRDLLSELEGYRDERQGSCAGSITVVEGDILNLRNIAQGSAELVVCMGDTLTHLQSTDQVRSLIQQAAATLLPGGVLVLHFRDLSFHLEGTDRFLPCQSDDNNIFTCVLEYEEPTQEGGDRYVVINDLYYRREGPGKPWGLKKSQYKKLEVPPSRVVGLMSDAGLDASVDAMGFGLVAVVGTKHS